MTQRSKYSWNPHQLQVIELAYNLVSVTRLLLSIYVGVTLAPHWRLLAPCLFAGEYLIEFWDPIQIYSEHRTVYL